MKIGILTLPLYINYGGILQAYALQEALRQGGHKAVLINRRNKKNPWHWYIIRFLMRLFQRTMLFLTGNKYDSKITDAIMRAGRSKAELVDINAFINLKIRRTLPVSDTKGMIRHILRKRYDAIIVGSDQVWRQEYNPYITDAFLPFLDADSTVARISYAASFGTTDCDISPDILEECRSGLSRFRAISVRERSGIDIVRNRFNLNARLVIDPTLLHDRNFYARLIRQRDKSLRPGLTTYILDDSPEKEQIIRSTMQSYGISRIKSLSLCRTDQYGRLTSVSEWLGSIAGAEMVVTDSFHGCVFSILFERPFIAIINAERGADRFLSLLEPLGLMDRIVGSPDNIPDTTIDYSEVNRRLDKLRSSSRQFLTDALNG